MGSFRSHHARQKAWFVFQGKKQKPLLLTCMTHTHSYTHTHDPKDTCTHCRRRKVCPSPPALQLQPPVSSCHSYHCDPVEPIKRLKKQYTQNWKYIFFLLPVELHINLDCFGVSCLVFGDICSRDFCLLSNIMGRNVELTAPQNIQYISKTQQ